MFRRAESILNVAAAPGADSNSSAIVLDRAGNLRVMNLEGWTRSGLIEEFGAKEVYLVKKRPGTVTVEGWSAGDHCSVTQKDVRNPWAGFPYAARSQVTPQLASGLNDLSPSVWNS